MLERSSIPCMTQYELTMWILLCAWRGHPESTRSKKTKKDGLPSISRRARDKDKYLNLPLLIKQFADIVEHLFVARHFTFVFESICFGLCFSTT